MIRRAEQTSLTETAATASAAVSVTAAAAARKASPGQGATADERRRALPGDDLVAHPDLVATRAITIDAPSSVVWPWVVSVVQVREESRSRGPEASGSQLLAVGDVVPLAEKVALTVARLDTGRALVLSATAGASVPCALSCAFVLAPSDDGSCRLVVRERYAFSAPWAAAEVEPEGWVGLQVTETMLRGIRDRAEAVYDGDSR